MTLRGVSSRKRVCFLSQRPRSNATSATTQKWSLANSSDGSAPPRTLFGGIRTRRVRMPAVWNSYSTVPLNRPCHDVTGASSPSGERAR